MPEVQITIEGEDSSLSRKVYYDDPAEIDWNSLVPDMLDSMKPYNNEFDGKKKVQQRGDS